MTKSAKKLLHTVQSPNNTPIGQGGMATIFKAKQPTLDREVVIKKIKDELKTHPTILKRFEREARASARLLHQNLSHVYDYVTDDDSPYIVMEYIDGVDVADILARRGSTPVDVGLAIMLGVTRALAYIHSHGLVHRDIKPENIRLSKTGDVKLMDFGIALKQAEESKLTLPGIIIGSPHYLSPEQILGESIGPRSDLFSLGITFYELLTGSRPFDSATQETVFYNIRKGIFKSPRKINKNIPRSVSNMINKLLQPKPERRYQSAWDIHQDIKDVLALNDERAYLRQYLIYESFVEPRPHEEVVPPKKPEGKRISKYFKYVQVALLALATSVGGWFVGSKSDIKTIVSNVQDAQKIAPNFCLASVEDASFFNLKERKRIKRIIYDEGFQIAGVPDLLRIKPRSKRGRLYYKLFPTLSKAEKRIILKINVAKNRKKLFSRPAIAWPKGPPCEKARTY